MSSILVVHFLGNESLNVCPKIFVSPSKNDDRKEKVKKEKKKKDNCKAFYVIRKRNKFWFLRAKSLCNDKSRNF